MAGRSNIFVVHSWDEADSYARMSGMLAERVAGLADYSLPPWKPAPGPEDLVKSSIQSRIGFATAVVVLNTPGLHDREMSRFEMQKAVDQEKRIIVLQPHGDFWRPIPEVLHGHVYRVSSWRSDSLGRAIRGEYPHDRRVFDISEAAERRAVVQMLAAGVGALSLVLLYRSVTSFSALTAELRASGVDLRWSAENTREVATYAVGGALVAGGLVGLLTRDWKAAAAAAVAGGLGGAAYAATRVYRAAIAGSEPYCVLAVDPL
jgi:hypothetical protein